jgi:hypothetical protein
MNFSILALTLLVAAPAMAGIAGRWEATSTMNDGNKVRSLLTIKETDGKVEASLAMGNRTVPVDKVAFAESQLSFRLVFEGTAVTVKAKLEGDKLTGAWTAEGGETGPVVAVRMAEAATSFYAGKWKLTATRPEGEPVKAELELKEEGGKWLGTIITRDGQSVPASVSLEGGNVTVTVDAYTLTLARDGEGMKGTAAGPNGTLPLTAVR